ncbi:HMG box-containing protein 1-like [Liolophura sinensis]|uniref:HMG box-containing protein 1-like n=1 Tax=Liolophura sinensis TaxID=3198878 RepID=UPI0031586E5A
MASVEVTAGKRPHVKTEKMQEYMRSHGDGGSQKILRCPVPGCDKVLSSAPGLRYHIKGHTGPERPFLCDRCRKTFKSANGLKYHIEKTKCDGSSEKIFANSETEGMEDFLDEDLCHHDEISVSDDFSDTSIDLSSQESPHKHLSSSSQSQCEGKGQSAQVDRLTELAIIATSPQSPLMQKSLPVRIDQTRGSVVRSLEKSLHTYTRPSECSPPWSTSSQDFSPPLPIHLSAPSSVESLPDNEDPCCEVEGDSVVTSSSPCPSCPQDMGSCDATWTHPWPTPVWQCFTKDCKIKFLSKNREEWQNAQDLADRQKLMATATCVQSELLDISYANNGLRLLEIHEVETDPCTTVELKLTPNLSTQPDVLVRCRLNHPFFVRDKGWSSLDPSNTAEHYGIPCRVLTIEDVCLSPSHPEATMIHDFTPMDTSAVFALSNMKKQRLDQEMSPKHISESPGKRSPSKFPTDGEFKPKRPMNSFMLFAKKYRVELTKKYPGRDNRAISVMLGDKWKQMTIEERDRYAQEARMLAEEQKKIHPDCWKRKRFTPDPP